MNTAEMKGRLEGEKVLLEAELATIGHKTATPGDWEAGAGDIDSTATEPDEHADAIEQFEANTAIVKELEIRLGDITLALKKIEDGTYGVCEVSGEQIEEDRLMANPAARTCMHHLKDEEGLPR